MARKRPKGIIIKITRPIEMRELRKDDVQVCVWTGTCWRSAWSFPYNPELAYCFDGSEPKVRTVPIEFPPPGTLSEDALLYRKTLLPKMRSMGIIKD